MVFEPVPHLILIAMEGIVHQQSMDGLNFPQQLTDYTPRATWATAP